MLSGLVIAFLPRSKCLLISWLQSPSVVILEPKKIACPCFHWKRSVFIPIPKKGNAKEYSNHCTIALISHASKIMLKILQARHETQAGIKISGRNNLRYADDTTFMAESEEELKSLLMKVKEESEKIDLKLNIKKTKIMASGPNTSWQIDGETVETVADFIFLGSKITEDGDCSHEIKRHLLLRRKVMTNLDSILKSRDITLPTKVCLVKAIVFPVVMYGCESWTVKKVEC